MVEELASPDLLEDEVELLSLLEVLHQLDDVLVTLYKQNKYIHISIMKLLSQLYF